MSETTDNIASRVGKRGANLKQRIKQDGKEKIESGKRAAAEQMEELADAIDVAGSQLDQSQPQLANYASKLAEGVGSIATRLRDDSIEDIYRDVRRLATQHPAMFLLGSAAVGLAIARFMKSEGGETFSDDSRGDNGESATSYAAGDDSNGDRSAYWSGSAADSEGSTNRQDPLVASQAAGV
jgi:hypothetical protein